MVFNGNACLHSVGALLLSRALLSCMGAHTLPRSLHSATMVAQWPSAVCDNVRAADVVEWSNLWASFDDKQARARACVYVCARRNFDRGVLRVGCEKQAPGRSRFREAYPVYIPAIFQQQVRQIHLAG